MLAPGRARSPVETEDRVGKARVLERHRCEALHLGRVRRLETDPLGRRREAGEMLMESERPTVVDAHRLEGGPTAREALVVGREHGRVGIDETATRNRHRSQGG